MKKDNTTVPRDQGAVTIPKTLQLAKLPLTKFWDLPDRPVLAESGCINRVKWF
jgi:hypothetical protein